MERPFEISESAFDACFFYQGQPAYPMRSPKAQRISEPEMTDLCMANEFSLLTLDSQPELLPRAKLSNRINPEEDEEELATTSATY